MYNESSKQAIMKCLEKNFEQIRIRAKKGTKEQWKQQAIDKGYPSLTAYIEDLIDKDK